MVSRLMNNYIFQIALFAFGYWAFAKIGLFMAIPPGYVTPVFPSPGLVVVGMLWFGYRLWPAAFIGEFITYYSHFPLLDLKFILTSLIVGLGAALQSFVSAYSLEFLAKTKDPFKNCYAAFVFILFSSILANLINSVIGPTGLVYLQVIPAQALPHTMLNWWIGDVMGVLAFGSTVMAWYSWRPSRLKFNFWQVLEITLFFCLLLALCWLIFIAEYHLAYMIILFPIWSTMRFGKRLGTLSALVISLFSIVGAVHGYVGLGGDYEGSQILLLQTFMGIVFITTLVQASLLNERETAYSDMEEMVNERTMALNERNVTLSNTLSSLKDAQEQMMEGEKVFSNVINSMPSPMIILDVGKTIIRWNDAAQKEAGVSLEVARGELITKIFPFLERELDKVSLAIEKKSVQKIDKFKLQDAKEERYFDLLIYPLVGANIERCAIIMNEITSEIKMSTTFQKQEKLASMGVLTASIVHEINNPINFITGNAKSLEHDVKDVVSILKQYLALHRPNPPYNIANIKAERESMDFNVIITEVDSLIKGIQEGVQRSQNIMKDLTALPHYEEDGKRESDIHQCLDSTLSLLKHVFKDKIELVKDYKPIPKIACYPGKLNQVFMNLLSNAIHAIKDKGTIRIRTEQVNDSILIGIKDSGQGIKKADLNRIFEPFFTTKEAGVGTGLGLSISRGIIADHKGTITVSSEVGVGTEFVITLPIT